MANTPPRPNLSPESTPWGRWASNEIQRLARQNTNLERQIEALTRSLSGVHESVGKEHGRIDVRKAEASDQLARIAALEQTLIGETLQPPSRPILTVGYDSALGIEWDGTLLGTPSPTNIRGVKTEFTYTQPPANVPGGTADGGGTGWFDAGVNFITRSQATILNDTIAAGADVWIRFRAVALDGRVSGPGPHATIKAGGDKHIATGYFLYIHNAQELPE